MIAAIYNGPLLERLLSEIHNSLEADQNTNRDLM